MVSEGEYLNALGEKLNEVSSVVQTHHSDMQSLARQLAELKAQKSELPNYFGNRAQIIEELEAQGYYKKDQPGLQDDVDNTFRMFTEVTPEGRLVEGLQHGNRPATLIELYQTMDLRGLVWNYGVGWISALKGGWNSAIGAKKKEAEDFINNLRNKRIEEYLKPEKDKIKDVVEYMESSGRLEFLDKTRIPSLYGSKKPKKEPTKKQRRLPKVNFSYKVYN